MIDIRHYEAMVKLDLPETERQWVSGRADMLTASFAALEAIETTGVEPLITVLDIHNVFREDIAIKTLPRGELLANAPEQYDGYFQVPKALQ